MQKIANGIKEDPACFWKNDVNEMPSPAPGERQMAPAKAPSLAKAPYQHKRRMTQMGESVQHCVEQKQDDTKSLALTMSRRHWQR